MATESPCYLSESSSASSSSTEEDEYYISDDNNCSKTNGDTEEQYDVGQTFCTDRKTTKLNRKSTMSNGKRCKRPVDENNDDSIEKNDKRSSKKRLRGVEHKKIYDDPILWMEAIKQIKSDILTQIGDRSDEIQLKIKHEFYYFEKYIRSNLSRSTKISFLKQLGSSLSGLMNDQQLVYSIIGKRFNLFTLFRVKERGTKSGSSSVSQTTYGSLSRINYPKIYGDNFILLGHPLAKLALCRSRKKGLKVDIEMDDAFYTDSFLFIEDGFIASQSSIDFLGEKYKDTELALVLNNILRYKDLLITQEALMPFSLCTSDIVSYTVDYLRKHNFDLRAILKVEQGMLETMVENQDHANCKGYAGRVIIAFEQWMKGVIRVCEKVLTRNNTINFVIKAMQENNIIPKTYTDHKTLNVIDIKWTYSQERLELDDLNLHILHIGPKNNDKYPSNLLKHKSINSKGNIQRLDSKQMVEVKKDRTSCTSSNKKIPLICYLYNGRYVKVRMLDDKQHQRDMKHVNQEEETDSKINKNRLDKSSTENTGVGKIRKDNGSFANSVTINVKETDKKQKN